MARFDKLESRIEQMEAEAELVNGKKKPTLEDEFDNLFVVYRRQACVSKVSHLNYGEPD